MPDAQQSSDSLSSDEDVPLAMLNPVIAPVNMSDSSDSSSSDDDVPLSVIHPAIAQDIAPVNMSDIFSVWFGKPADRRLVVTRKDVQHFFKTAAPLLHHVKKTPRHSCRIRASPGQVFMLVKLIDDNWALLNAADEEFKHPDIIQRSFCAQAWLHKSPLYSQIHVPPYSEMLDKTEIYTVDRSMINQAKDGFLIITDPPALPYKSLRPFDNILQGVRHDLLLDDALQFAPELGGCPVSHVYMFMNDDEMIRVDAPLPPNSMPLASMYQLLKLSHTKEPVNMVRDGHIRARPIKAHSVFGPDGLVNVIITDADTPIQYVNPDGAAIKKCMKLAKRRLADQEYFRPREMAESWDLRPRAQKRLDDVSHSVDVLWADAVCANNVDYTSTEEWPDYFSDPDHRGQTMVTIFTKRGMPGQCYVLSDLLHNLTDTTVFKWVGDPSVGDIDAQTRFYRLPAPLYWLDQVAFDLLESSGARLFQLLTLSPQRVGKKSGDVMTIDVHTLAPITNELAKMFRIRPTEEVGQKRQRT
jgi:hypothetical protein